MRYLAWIITLPLGLAIVLFAISNREPVALSVWPLQEALQLPVYLAVLVPFVLGLIGGAFVVWVGAAAARRRVRRLEARLDAAEAVLRATQEARARERLVAERRDEEQRVQRERRATALIAANEKLAPAAATSPAAASPTPSVALRSETSPVPARGVAG